MSALHDLTVAQLAAKLKAREVSAVEAAQHFLARSRQHADLGAYLAQDDAVTLAQAQAADARLAAATRRCWPACPSRTRTSSSPPT